MTKPKIGIIVGSTREGRFADHPAEWIAQLARDHGGFEVEVLDLRDFPMPFFDEAASPAWVPSQDETAQRWQKKIDSLDGFIMTVAEYNRGPTGVLKNAIDYASNEWNNKPVAFVGYGGVGGARAVEQLRLIAVELQMAPIRNGVHIQWAVYEPVAKGEKKLAEFDFLNDTAKGMLDQLAWWANALTAARAKDGQQSKAA
ncbi:MAG: NADPH-dependent FMN reductase [Rhizobiaceae bacterium]